MKEYIMKVLHIYSAFYLLFGFEYLYNHPSFDNSFISMVLLEIQPLELQKLNILANVFQ